MNTLQQDLAQKQYLVSDGAWGTFLTRLGLQPGECPELWNLDRPDAIATIARAYHETGADLVSTNTFGASRFKLDHFGLADQAAEINRAAAAISREVVGPDAHVFASIGPTGKILMMGDLTEEELYDAFKEQATALEEGGADACCIETMMAIDEAAIAIRAAKQNTNLEIISTFTFDKMTDGSYKTMMGATPTDTATAAIEAGAHIVGANCGQGPEGMIQIAKEIREALPDTPIIIQANAGLPIREGDQDIFPETPEGMAQYVPQLIHAGANIIGGCCGTTPEHIQAIVQAIKKAKL